MTNKEKRTMKHRHSYNVWFISALIDLRDMAIAYKAALAEETRLHALKSETDALYYRADLFDCKKPANTLCRRRHLAVARGRISAQYYECDERLHALRDVRRLQEHHIKHAIAVHYARIARRWDVNEFAVWYVEDMCRDYAFLAKAAAGEPLPVSEYRLTERRTESDTWLGVKR